jgi:hypothetical protein
MFRYFADTNTGDIILKEEYTRRSFFNQSEVWVDDTRDLEINAYKIDLATLQLVEKTP